MPHSAHRSILMKEIEKQGFKPKATTTKNGKLLLQWEVNGVTQHYIAALTPSDHRATFNARAQIRRMIQTEIGDTK